MPQPADTPGPGTCGSAYVSGTAQELVGGTGRPNRAMVPETMIVCGTAGHPAGRTSDGSVLSLWCELLCDAGEVPAGALEPSDLVGVSADTSVEQVSHL